LPCCFQEIENIEVRYRRKEMTMSIGRNQRYFITAGAAIGIMFFSAVGMAGLMGWIPPGQTANGAASGYGYALPVSPDQPTVVGAENINNVKAEAPGSKIAANVADTSAAKVDAPKNTKSQQRETTQRETTKAVSKALPPQPDTTKTIKACQDCAKVVAINEIEQKGDSNGLGLVAGGVVGGLVGNQVGKGRGNVLMTVIGAGGGAYAGNEIQKKVNSKKVYVVKLRTDDGKLHTLTEPTAPSYLVGDQVRLHDGKVSAV
jgi:outer membrane lipoprotein SlyB